MPLSQRAKAIARPAVVGRLSKLLPDLAPGLMQLSQFWPHDYGHDYARPTSTTTATMGAAGSADLPVPPPEFWAYYCTSAESYLASGREDVKTMRSLLAESGAPVEQAERVLDLGCAGGRMIRWMTDLAENGTQLWGTDIWASAILWCQDNLNPPCNFATTTMIPHLPFEDRSFDLIYCGSLFTHIDDLAESWFLELHRILKPGGRLYFSINDRHAEKIFAGEGDPSSYPGYYERTGGKQAWDDFVEQLNSSPGYAQFRANQAYMVTMGRSMSAHVIWDTDELTRRLSYGFRSKAITPASYGHQTTVLLERL